MNEIEDTPVIAKTTILIVAHVRLYREGLAALLNSREHLEVSSTADDCETALRAIATSAPDVAVIDITVPGALEIIPALRSSATGTKVIAFALHDDEGQIIACIEAGASGYVTADSSLSALIATIEGVARDELPCSPRIAATFVRRLAERAARKELPIDAVILTGRERQVLRLLREGLSNKEIGQQLNIAEATVKNHVHHLLEKLDVSSRNQAVARFARVLDTDPIRLGSESEFRTPLDPGPAPRSSRLLNRIGAERSIHIAHAVADNSPDYRMRVLVRDVPRMLRDILEETIGQQRDMELVRDVTPRARSPEQQPDVVIIGTSAPRDVSGPTDALERWPRSHILMIATSGSEAVMYELQQRQTPLGEMSPAGLVDAIRTAYASSAQRRARQSSSDQRPES